MLYKGWLIEENFAGWYEGTHPDFDGPEDNRYVQEKTLKDCKSSIDDWIWENE